MCPRSPISCGTQDRGRSFVTGQSQPRGRSSFSETGHLPSKAARVPSKVAHAGQDPFQLEASTNSRAPLCHSIWPAPGQRLGVGRLDGKGHSPRTSTGDSQAGARAVAFALSQQGKPYEYGAEGPDAYDCSGVVWLAWQHAGLRWELMSAAAQWRWLHQRRRRRPGQPAPRRESAVLRQRPSARLLPCFRFHLDLGKAELAKPLQNNEIQRFPGDPSKPAISMDRYLDANV